MVQLSSVHGYWKKKNIALTIWTLENFTICEESLLRENEWLGQVTGHLPGTSYCNTACSSLPLTSGSSKDRFLGKSCHNIFIQTSSLEVSTHVSSIAHCQPEYVGALWSKLHSTSQDEMSLGISHMWKHQVRKSWKDPRESVLGWDSSFLSQMPLGMSRGIN